MLCKYSLSEYIKQREKKCFKKISRGERDHRSSSTTLHVQLRWKEEAVPWEGVIFPSRVKAAPWNTRSTPIDSFQRPKGWSSLKEPLSRDHQLSYRGYCGPPGDETSSGHGQLKDSQGPFGWTEGPCVTPYITPSGHGRQRGCCGVHPSPETFSHLVSPQTSYYWYSCSKASSRTMQGQSAQGLIPPPAPSSPCGVSSVSLQGARSPRPSGGLAHRVRGSCSTGRSSVAPCGGWWNDTPL